MAMAAWRLELERASSRMREAIGKEQWCLRDNSLIQLLSLSEIPQNSHSVSESDFFTSRSESKGKRSYGRP